MPAENQMFSSMLHAARERLIAQTPTEIARKSGALFADGEFSLRSLGREVRISADDCRAHPALPEWHLLTLLHYLSNADGAPLTGRPISFSQYPGGMARGENFSRNAERIAREKLSKMDAAELERRCRALGAGIIPSNADFCAEFSFAPRWPVWLKLWLADDEFPASGSMLVDESAAHYLTIEDAVTVGSLILDALTDAAEWSQ